MNDAKEKYQHIKKQADLEIIFAKENSYEIKVNSEEQGYNLYNMLAQSNINVNKFEIKKPSLHDIFIEKVGASK